MGRHVLSLTHHGSDITLEPGVLDTIWARSVEPQRPVLFTKVTRRRLFSPTSSSLAKRWKEESGIMMSFLADRNCAMKRNGSR